MFELFQSLHVTFQSKFAGIILLKLLCSGKWTLYYYKEHSHCLFICNWRGKILLVWFGRAEWMTGWDELKLSFKFAFRGFFFRDAELSSCLPDLFQIAVSTLVERSGCSGEKLP